jgi:hypothetical protein
MSEEIKFRPYKKVNNLHEVELQSLIFFAKMFIVYELLHSIKYTPFTVNYVLDRARVRYVTFPLPIKTVDLPRRLYQCHQGLQAFPIAYRFFDMVYI